MFGFCLWLTRHVVARLHAVARNTVALLFVLLGCHARRAKRKPKPSCNVVAVVLRVARHAVTETQQVAASPQGGSIGPVEEPLREKLAPPPVRGPCSSRVLLYFYKMLLGSGSLLVLPFIYDTRRIKIGIELRPYYGGLD